MIKWLDDVVEDDYKAAENYLTLLLDGMRAKQVVNTLRTGKITHRRANDILRAAYREPLTESDPGVASTRKHLAQGKELSPVLLVSFDHSGDIADGYHRVSAAYNDDPFDTVPCRIAEVPWLVSRPRV